MSSTKPPTNPQALQHARDLRHDQTGPELKLWALLRGGRLCGLKFRRQHPIGIYIVDFYCHEHRLIIEIDGNSHIGRADYDRQRQHYLESQGYTFLRLDNDEVLKDDEAILMAILKACGRDPFTGGPA